MQLVSKRDYKSLHHGELSGVELSALTVLTGPNGSGKSNLLEALQQNIVIFDDFGDLAPNQVRLFGLGQLLAAAEGPVQASSFKEPWANLFNSVQSWKQQAPQSVPGGSGDQSEQWINEQVINSQLLTAPALERFTGELGKPLSAATITDYQNYAPLIAGVRDPFAASIAEVFLTYSARKQRHDVAQWRFATKGEGTHISDEEFYGRYGPAPWTLLDETLAIVGLPYSFDPPPDDMETVNFEVTLTSEIGEVIRPADLSSGERVLLAIAMGLFTGSTMSEAIELPRLLLLDEADASLHPSMVKSLLTVIEEVFVGQYGVRVLLSTHSPTTVALAPESSLYVMGRSVPRLRRTDTDQAMKLLTVGMSSLSVRLDNRRQVFVESEYDQAIYQELFALIKGRLNTDKSAEFIAAGRRDVGGGCEMVKRLVKELRSTGSDTVSGIVDRDQRQNSPAHIYYLDDRYSIENLVFDPLLLGAFLLREQVLPAEELRLPAGMRNFQLREEHATVIVGSLSAKLGLQDGATRPVKYVGGFTAEVPEGFLDTQGHALEQLIVDTFPPLNVYQRLLKRQIVKRAVGDVPHFVPLSLIQLLERILEG